MNLLRTLSRQILFVLGWLALSGVAVATESVTYYHNDVAGTPVLATDAGGNLLWKETYLPYGKKQTNAVASGENRIGFTGKPYDNATGLSYLGARYYDPLIGRFNGIDPNGFDPANLQSFNRYAYANNNPYKFVDPDGRQATLLWCFGGPAACAAGIALTSATAYYGVKAVQETSILLQSRSEGAEEVAGDGGKKVPNPDGKKGGKEHQDKIGDVVADIEGRDLRPETEVPIDTPGGHKGKRFADVGAYDSEGNLVEVHQVGRQTQGRNPVSRERKAMDDIRDASGINPTFHPYNGQ